jgi:hypothetical protein
MRKLGSFNQRVNLTRHAEDRTPSKAERPAVKTLQTGGYTLGIARNLSPSESYAATGSQFEQSKGTPGRRMAGQALDTQLTRSTGLPPVNTAIILGSAELRTPNIPQ